jgi:hypothetical protein
MSDATMGLLEALGVRYDLTPEPGQAAESSHRPGHVVTGCLPDYSDVPASPYRPARGDYRSPDRAGGGAPLWVIPVTTAPVLPFLRHLYYRAFCPSRPRGAVTALLSHQPALFARIIDHALQRPTPYLALPLRVGALANSRLARRVSANLTALLRHPRSGQFAWVTPAGALAVLGLETPGIGHGALRA